MLEKLRKHLLCQCLVFCQLLTYGCGGNVFHDSNAKKDPVEEAIQDMDKGNVDGAIAILQGLLTGIDPATDDAAMIKSILASAYLQKHKVDLVNLIVIVSQAIQTHSLDPLTILFDFLPDATADHIAGVRTAIDLLLSINIDKRNTIDDVKLAMSLLAYLGLHLKVLDTNHDNRISREEIDQLGQAAADEMAQELGDVAYATAAHYVANAPSEAASLTVLNKKISDIQAGAQSAAGSSGGQKLKGYLASVASGGTPSTFGQTAFPPSQLPSLPAGTSAASLHLLAPPLAAVPGPSAGH